jgi:hypothetical protein
MWQCTEASAVDYRDFRSRRWNSDIKFYGRNLIASWFITCVTQCMVVLSSCNKIFFFFNFDNAIQIWKPFFIIFLDYSCLNIGTPIVWQCRRTCGSTRDYRRSVFTVRITEHIITQYFPGCFSAYKFFSFCVNISGEFHDKAIRSQVHELHSIVGIQSSGAFVMSSLQLLPHLLLLTYCAAIGNQCCVLSWIFQTHLNIFSMKFVWNFLGPTNTLITLNTTRVLFYSSCACTCMQHVSAFS